MRTKSNHNMQEGECSCSRKPDIPIWPADHLPDVRYSYLLTEAGRFRKKREQ
jgi:hypothetical protein